MLMTNHSTVTDQSQTVDLRRRKASSGDRFRYLLRQHSKKYYSGMEDAISFLSKIGEEVEDAEEGTSMSSYIT